MNTPLRGKHDDVQRRGLAVRQFARLHDAPCSLQRLDTFLDAPGSLEFEYVRSALKTPERNAADSH